MGPSSIYIFILFLFAFVTCIQLPLEWSEVNIPGERTSMSTILDSSGSVYLCGGQISLFGKSSKCVGIEIEKEINTINYSIKESFDGGKVIKSAGPFPGLYLNAKSFSSESQNEGGIFGDRMCMFISDGTNKPKCWCCDITDIKESPSSNIKCDDLQYTINGGCPERFEACVVHDKTRNTIYQIGGYYGQNIYNSILCFDLETETYLIGDNCGYGELLHAMYGLGCAVIPDEESSIIIVGGSHSLSRSSSAEFSSLITICNNNECKASQLSLNEGVLSTRVFAIDECHIGIVGGIIQTDDGSEISSDKMNIANICTEQWLDQVYIPLPLSEMAIIKTNGILCLYGGKSIYYNTITPEYSKYAYCTDLGTASVLTPVPTSVPTSIPTSIPTPIPTSASIGNIDLLDPSFKKEFVSFSFGVDGQSCFADDLYLYVCGGYSDGGYSECFVYNDLGDVLVLPIYIVDNGNLVRMPSFYCKNDCSAVYNDDLFLVHPAMVSGDVHFFKCSFYLDNNDNRVVCIDLCDDIRFCDDLIKFESCVTSSGQYLYISGGYDISGELSDDITVFDMDPLSLSWVSVPHDSFPSLVGYNSNFGSLSIPTSAHSCSVWNSSLYIIGGKDTLSIQICDDNECIISPIALSDTRYNGRSIVIGSSIVTVCGTSAIVEVYDAFKDESFASSILWSGARTSCCLIDWASQSQVIISGGDINNMILSPYTIRGISDDNDAADLLQCQHINIDTRDFSFKSIYSIYNEINDYYIFATEDKKAYLIIDASGIQKTWIYNYTEKTSCYYNSYNGDIVALGPGLWTKPRTRYSQTQSILITMTCNDALYGSISTQNDHRNAFILWGITEPVFITIVVVAALVVITVLLVGFCCCLKINTNKQHTQLSTNKDDDETSDDDYKTITIVRHHTNEDGRVRDSLSDDNKSSSTVNPHEVTFEAQDTNTVMLDKIALEIKTLNNTEQSSLTIHRNMLKPQQTPLLHVAPPVQATMFADD